MYNNRDIESTYTIWGVNAENILANYEDFDDKLRCPIKFFVPNYIGNEHIKLQKGLLTYKEIADYQNNRLKQFKVEPFDEVLLKYFETLKSNYNFILSDGIQLFKILIPTKRAVEEFDILSKEGYNAASIFSGY